MLRQTNIWPRKRFEAGIKFKFMVLIIFFHLSSEHMNFHRNFYHKNAFQNTFVSSSHRPTDDFICMHRKPEKKGHERKKKGLKLVSRLRSDPLRNQIQRPVTQEIASSGTNKQIFIQGLNRFSHAYPMVCLPGGEFIDDCLPKKGWAVVVAVVGRMTRTGLTRFTLWLQNKRVETSLKDH